MCVSVMCNNKAVTIVYHLEPDMVSVQSCFQFRPVASPDAAAKSSPPAQLFPQNTFNREMCVRLLLTLL